MEQLLDRCRKNADQAEVYGLDNQSHTVQFEDGRLKNITSDIQSGVSIRLIRGDRLGFAYTKNLSDRDELIANAGATMVEGTPARFSFPRTTGLPDLDSFDPAYVNTTNTDLVNECARIARALAARVPAQINIIALRESLTIRLLNAAGTDATARISLVFINVQLLFPGTYSSIHRSFASKRFTPVSDPDLDFLARLYHEGLPIVTPAPGPLKALFMPDAMYVPMWRLSSATSGRSVFQGESPLAERMGQRIFSEHITVVDDPRDDRHPTARAFDDEGTPAEKLTLVENGTLRSFYYDLEYAQRLSAKSTGHGYRSSMWGGDPVTTKPGPFLEHLILAAGSMSFAQLVASMDRGIIIGGALGGHSGNIPNGDFSIGLSPGLYVENGRIQGRAKNAMIAGNIYDLFTRVIGVGDTLYPTAAGRMPALLVDQATLAIR